MFLWILVSFQPAVFAQKTTTGALNDLYGLVAADSIRADLKANHVKGIQKIMNKGGHTMSAELDRNGQVIRYQYNQGFVVDSMVYDNKGRLLRYFVIANDHIEGYTEYIYDDKDLPTIYQVNKNGERTLKSTATLAKQRDTGIVTTLEEDGTKSITKTYIRKDIEYTILTDIDKNGNEEQRILYTLKDIKNKTSTLQDHLLEYGELDYLAGVRDTIPVLLENGAYNIGQHGDSLMYHLALLEETEDLNEQKRIVGKYFPQLAAYEGARKPYIRYQYEQKTGRVLYYSEYPGAHKNKISYTANDRVAKVTEEPEREGGTTLYEYGKNGLPVRMSNPEAPEQEALFQYEYFR